MGDFRADLAAGADVHAGSIDLALRRHGVSPEALRGLARKAAVDYYAVRGGSIGGDLLESAIAFVLTPGMQAVVNYDPERSGGASVTTFAYRRMKQRMTDFLRSKAEGFGDARFGNDDRVTLTSDGEVPSAVVAQDSVEQAAEQLAGGLSERSAWTLRHVATAVAAGSTLAEVADELMRDLADELAVALPDDLRSQIVVGPAVSADVFEAWLGEAA